MMETLFSGIQAWIEATGAWAYVIAPAVMAIVAILPIPAEAPAMMNGMLFGPVVGTAISWTGAMVGAWISFELARSVGRPVAHRFVSASALAKADEIAQGAGWWGLLVARLIPLISFTALNWGSGLCSVPRGRFLWTTALGILPGAIVFTSSGTGLALLLRRSPAAAGWTLLAVLVLGTWWTVRRRATSTDPAADPTETSTGT